MNNPRFEESQIDQALALNPRHIPFLVRKAEILSRRGEDRAASVFYSTALRTGANNPHLSARFTADLQHAQRAMGQLQQKFKDHLARRLTEAGYGSGSPHPRFQEALEIAMGSRVPEIGAEGIIQQPTSFFYPRLPQRQFYERSEFDWVSEIEASTAAILEELRLALREEGHFKPYMERDPQGPANYHPLIEDPSWSVLYLCRKGATVEENVRRFPKTLASLKRAPLPQIRGRAPNILFSLLRPGTHIPPHSGIVNTQLICHVPVITPAGCYLRVGTETKTWEQGKMLIFDDSVNHEAWNRSSETRVVLLFDIWRPEIGGAERGALTALFEAVEEYRA